MELRIYYELLEVMNLRIMEGSDEKIRIVEVVFAFSTGRSMNWQLAHVNMQIYLQILSFYVHLWATKICILIALNSSLEVNKTIHPILTWWVNKREHMPSSYELYHALTELITNHGRWWQTSRCLSYEISSINRGDQETEFLLRIIKSYELSKFYCILYCQISMTLS